MKVSNEKTKAILKITILVALFVILLVADLVSKQVVCAITKNGEDIIVIEKVLEFTYSENTGASFGIFGESTLFLTIFTSIVCVGMIVFLFWKRKVHAVLQYGLVVMLAGALGNLVDRIAFGYVRDFINYKFIETIFKTPFAICNFADLVLIVGAIIMIVYVLFFYDKQFKKPPQTAEKFAQSGEDNASIENLDMQNIDIENETSSDEKHRLEQNSVKQINQSDNEDTK